ncbi:MAG: hypothetical protein INR71_10210, partial [Terriglobus roseus]|nr:hypothetical protein [Terriglobus roseus]
VGRLAEAKWAFPSAETSAVLQRAPRGVELFVTRDASAHGEVDGAAGSSRGGGLPAAKGEIAGEGEAIELEEREHLMAGVDGGEAANHASTQGLVVRHWRPDLRAIVDDTFNATGGRVAVLVCGPASMNAELRRAVGAWVRQGRDVFWHAEEFGL